MKLKQSKSGSIKQKLLKNMICEVIYGPRLDNDVDHQVLENLADRLLSDSGPDLPKLPSYPEKGRTAANKYISNLPIAQTGEILGGILN